MTTQSPVTYCKAISVVRSKMRHFTQFAVSFASDTSLVLADGNKMISVSAFEPFDDLDRGRRIVRVLRGRPAVRIVFDYRTKLANADRSSACALQQVFPKTQMSSKSGEVHDTDYECFVQDSGWQ